MKYKHYVIAALLGGALAAPASVYADQRPEELIRKSAQTLEQLKANKVVPPATLSRAKCVGVFPQVNEAALVIGGSHGDGVISCKNADGKWSRVGFVDLTQGSLGAQIGAKRSDIVMAFLSDKSREAISKGTFTLGGDLTATFGSFDKEANIDTAGPDIVAFASDSGLFVGASLNGTKISADEGTMKEFYNEKATLGNAMENFSKPVSIPEEQLIGAISAVKAPQG